MLVRWNYQITSPLRKARAVSLGFCCSLIVLSTACDQPITGASTPPPSRRQAGAPLEATLGVGGRSSRGIDAEFRRIEAIVPGFGGYFLNESGAIVAYLKDLTYEEALRNTLAALMTTERPHEYNPLSNATGIEIRQGQYSYSELSDWQGALSQSFGRIEGFSAIDANEALNRISISITVPSAEDALTQQAIALGIPQEALVFYQEEQLYPRAQTTLLSLWSPLVGGIQITEGNEYCTLGFNDHATDPNERFFITAAHCVNDPTMTTGQTGAEFHQPTVWRFAAEVDINVPWNYSDSACGTYTLCTTSDAMRLIYAMPLSALKVKVTGTGSLTVTGEDSITSVVTPTMGMSLTKVGISTGTSVGEVVGTCENRVTTGDVGSLMNLCVDRVLATLSFGDSGAPVTYKLSSNRASMAGILVGGATGGGYIFTNHAQIVATLGSFTPY